MKINDMRKNLFLGKNGHIECKTIYDKKLFGQYICGCLNSRSGYLIYKPEKKITSTEIDNIQNEISKVISTELTPHAPVFIKITKLEQKELLLIEIPEGQDKPYSFDGAFYLFDQNKIRPATINEIKNMISDNQIAPTRFERQYSDEISMDDLSTIELSRLNNKVILNNEYPLEYHLEKLSLLRQGRFTKAADIILTKNPAIRHPQSRVRAVCYLNKSENEYQDFKILEGPLLQLFEELLNFIIRNTSTTAIFSKTDAQRKTNFQYPINAIREGLINAFAHRDYSSYSGGIKVEISPKQLSIWNSGSLPLGVSIKSLKNGQISILRNPDIANYLHFQGYMEMLGRGSVLIQDECKKANLPSPEWKADSLGVTLTFFATSHSTEITNTELLTLYNAELKTTSKLNDVMTALTIQDMSQSEIAFALKLNSVSGALKRAIDILENKFKFIEKVVPQKTRSKMQKYHLTSLGANFWHLYKK